MNFQPLNVGDTLFVEDKRTQQLNAVTITKINDFELTLSDGRKYIHCRNGVFDIAMPLSKNGNAVFATEQDYQALKLWEKLCDKFSLLVDENRLPRYLRRQIIRVLEPELTLHEDYYIRPLSVGSEVLYAPIWGKIGGQRRLSVKRIRNSIVTLSNGVKFDLEKHTMYCLGKSVDDTPEPLRGYIYQSESDLIEQRAWDRLSNELFWGVYTKATREQIDQISKILIDSMSQNEAKVFGIYKLPDIAA